MSSPKSRSSRGTLLRLLDRYTLDPFRSATIDLAPVPAGYKLLVVLGYVLFAALAVLSLAFDLFDPEALGVIRFSDDGGASFETSQLVLVAAVVGFAVSWSYLLAGGVQARWWVLVPVLALFLLAALLAAVFGAEALFGLALLVAVLATGAAVVGRRRGWFPARSAVLLVAFAILLLVGTLALSGSAAPQLRAQVLYVLFFFLTQPILLIWLFSGLSIMNFSMSFGQSVVRRLRDDMSEAALKRFGVVIALTHVLVDVLLWLLLQANPIGALFAGVVLFDLLLSLLLIPLLLLMAGRRQWTAQNAGLLIAVRITAFVFTLVYAISQVIGVNLSDPVYAVVEKLGVIPPSFFATVTMILSVAGFFVPFANADGARLPRAVRVLLVLGLALLAVTVMFFNANTLDLTTGQSLASEPIYASMFWAGTVLLGIPFLVFSVFRNRQALIGPEDGWARAYSGALGGQKRNTAAYLFVLLIPLVLVICGCGLAALSFTGGG